MKITKRFMLTAGVFFAASIVGLPAVAQEKFPSEPIEIISHASAGGGTDTALRSLQPALAEALGVPVNITIKKGGSGRVAMNYAKGKEADGYSMMVVTPTHLYTMAQGVAPLGVDNIVGIARMSDDPLMVVARADSPFATAEALMTKGDRPTRWGMTYVGSIDHASVETFARGADISISAVPFEGSGELLTNLIGGSIDVASLNLTEAKDAIQRGDLVAVAIMTPERVASLPDTPTSNELGVHGEFSTVRGLVTSNDVPEERRAILEAALLKAMQSERYQDLLKNSGTPLDSPASSAVWDSQLRTIYQDGVQVLTGLGMIK